MTLAELDRMRRRGRRPEPFVQLALGGLCCAPPTIALDGDEHAHELRPLTALEVELVFPANLVGDAFAVAREVRKVEPWSLTLLCPDTGEYRCHVLDTLAWDHNIVGWNLYRYPRSDPLYGTGL